MTGNYSILTLDSGTSEDLTGQIADRLGITVFQPEIIGLFKIVLGADRPYGVNYSIQA